MRKSFLVVLLMVLLIAGVQWYKSSAAVCPVPLGYRLGDINESFSLTTDEARAYIEEAESLWEEEVNRELFIYDESAELSINFIFDERQALANSEITQREALDEQRETNESVLRTVESLQNKHKELSEIYKRRLAEYQTDLAEYNIEVKNYNDRGGAPPDVYKSLEATRLALNKEADALSDLVKELNGLAKRINNLGERGEELVNEYNQDVNHYNEEFVGYDREFTQGDYQGGHINIYKYSNETELVTVLAHEFGHALGIGHVESSSSIMYYLLDDTNESLKLSDDDLATYQTVCGTRETTSQKIRRTIRESLAKF